MHSFDFGAAANTFRLNTFALAQSNEGSKVGEANVGIHMQLGYNPTDELNNCWTDRVREIFLSMQAVANRNVSYTVEDVSRYLQFCFWMDAALAEAKKDLSMVQWRDARCENALADYFGSAFQTVYNAAQADGTLPWFQWNTMATRMASEFAHPHFAFFDQYEYLLGSVFKDDTSGRAQYLYFHYYNTSLQGTSPDYKQALVAAGNMLSEFDAKLLNPTDPAHLTLAKVNDIRADMLNALGSQLNRDYGVVLDFRMIPDAIYDPLLIQELNNWRIAPRAIYSASGPTPVYAPDCSRWDLGSVVNAVDALVAASGFVGNGFIFAQDKSLDQAISITTFYTTADALPIKVVGNQFAGSNALHNFMFFEQTSITSTGSGEQLTVTLTPRSDFGLVFGQMWCNVKSAVNFTWSRIFIVPSYGVRETGATVLPINAIVGASHIQAADFGNIAIYRYNQTNLAAYSYAIYAEDIDEWATISLATLKSYFVAVQRAMFNTGIVMAKSINTREKVARDNKVSINSNRGERRNDYGEKKKGRKTSKYNSVLKKMAGR